MTTERPHDRHEEEPTRGPGEAPRSQPEAEARCLVSWLASGTVNRSLGNGDADGSDRSNRGATLLAIAAGAADANATQISVDKIRMGRLLIGSPPRVVDVLSVKFACA
jgi:hypothetical protein